MLWLIRRPEGQTDYDETAGFVICTRDNGTEDDVRLMAARKAGDEGADVWLNRDLSQCFEITHCTMPGVVLQDYRAG